MHAGLPHRGDGIISTLPFLISTVSPFFLKMGLIRSGLAVTRPIPGPAGTSPCLGLPDQRTTQTQAVEARVNCSVPDRQTVQSVQVSVTCLTGCAVNKKGLYAVTLSQSSLSKIKDLHFPSLLLYKGRSAHLRSLFLHPPPLELPPEWGDQSRVWHCRHRISSLDKGINASPACFSSRHHQTLHFSSTCSMLTVRSSWN